MVSLDQLFRPIFLETKGTSYREHLVSMGEMYLHPGDQEIKKMISTIFNYQRFERCKQVKCWSDIVPEYSNPGHYMTWNSTYMIGVFYNEEDILSHFFVRKLKNWQRSLDKWKEDLIFPSGVRYFSVFCMPPADFDPPTRCFRDPHNHLVTMLRWEQVEEMGLNPEFIIEHMRDDLFMAEQEGVIYDREVAKRRANMRDGEEFYG